MTVYVIACLSVNADAQDDYQTYLETAVPVLERVGGRVAQHFPVGDAVVGNKVAETIMVVEYPDMQAVDTLFQSPEYKAIIPVRDRAFETYNVSIVS